MSEYEKQAKEFLANCNATINIEYVGLEIPNWDTKQHATYDCIIRTPKGAMCVHFYTSLVNTRKNQMPTEYDILACLQTYDVGSMDEFMAEFGYEIKCVRDMTNFINTYNAVVKEYNDIRRCFTQEQIEMLAEIQ